MNDDTRLDLSDMPGGDDDRIFDDLAMANEEIEKLKAIIDLQNHELSVLRQAEPKTETRT
jgi:hypothetical protein